MSTMMVNNTEENAPLRNINTDNVTTTPISMKENARDENSDRNTEATFNKLLLKAYPNIKMLHQNKSYFTIKEYNSMVDKSEHSMSIYSQNINSLNKHFEELECLLDSIKNKFDLITLTEIRTNFNSAAIQLTNYNHIFKLPNNSDFGGVLIYYRNNLQVLERNDLAMENQGIEGITVEIKNKNNSTIITGIYKHPYVTIQQFQIELDKLVKKIQMEVVSLLQEI